ncbi:GIY-YIG nuclease family protein [Alphaproteobacteria bacterium endosymbiont of Tiliacea citrago]|uniref:GIY-YIG nuclease family protein n=1 Tax=Alphaproteobacteria bacterium endosymbiont of Tiliacea citrago TaxID=3077944 RepID=UPI00313E8BE1
MNEILIEEQKKLPEKPGVYVFLGKKEKVLYIGKAKNLKKRTKYYFKLDNLSNRFLQMINEAIELKFYITENENEAFLLEAQLIKEKQPQYNIQYKNGRSFTYITFSKHEYPKILIKKKWEKDAIGPFLSYYNIQQIIQELLTIFQVRTCSDFSFKRRKRPCLEYFSKKCSAPCVQLISSEEYNKKVQQMKDLFNGKNKEILKTLTKELSDHIINEKFELAAKLRDNINLLIKIKEKQGIFFDNIKQLDIVLFYQNIFYIESIKNGAIVNIEYRKYEPNIEKKDVLFTYYLDEPKHKIIGKEPLFFFKYTNKLSDKEMKIVNFAQDRFNNLISEENEAFCWKNILKLEKLNTVEAYDCSHYNGKFALCGRVKFNIYGEILKNEYKVWRYNQNSFNDLEILEFGLKKRSEEDDFPDLILIDGGKTQLEIAKKALFPFSKIIAYAKGENRRGGILYDYNCKVLDINNENLLKFFEKLRQAAHNWAKKNAMYRFSSKY